MSGSWEELARESYDRVAEPYAAATREAVDADPYMRATYDLLGALAREAGGRVADVGCGPGWWAAHLAGLGLRVEAVDVSPAMVELTRRNAPSAHAQVGSVLDLPLPDAAVDAVVCWYVLHHLPDAVVDAALAQLVRVLRPGGVLLIGGHVGDDSRRKTEGYGGLAMDVAVNRRPAGSWEERVRTLRLQVEAHHVFGPGSAHPSHALFARRSV